MKAEWEDLRDHDVVFLITIDRPAGDSGSAQESASKWEEESLDFPTRYGECRVFVLLFNGVFGDYDAKQLSLSYKLDGDKKRNKNESVCFWDLYSHFRLCILLIHMCCQG